MTPHIWQEALLSGAALDRIIGAAGLAVVTADNEPEHRQRERERFERDRVAEIDLLHDAVERGRVSGLERALAEERMRDLSRGRVALVDAADTEAACRRVLNVIAGQLAHAMSDGPRLSRRNHLLPLLKAWKRWQRWHRSSGERRANARANLSKLVESARDNGRYPIPSPFDMPAAFEEWLADESVAHEIEREKLLDCLGADALHRAESKTQRARSALTALKPDAESLARADVRQELAYGGRPANRDADRRLEMLLALFWRLFNADPNASVAKERPRAPCESLMQPTAEDGGAAARFVAAFEAECADAIKRAGIGDPLRPFRPRPQKWAARNEKAIAEHIRDLSKRRGRSWERWVLIGVASDALLIRPAPSPRRT